MVYKGPKLTPEQVAPNPGWDEVQAIEARTKAIKQMSLSKGMPKWFTKPISVCAYVFVLGVLFMVTATVLVLLGGVLNKVVRWVFG